MEWINIVQNTLNYIEDHLLEDINADKIASQFFISSIYFQKIFSIITGFTINDYIKNRRLSLAGEELAGNKIKIIDAALKYGYESPESFTKAFTRFHGFTPSSLRKGICQLNYFLPLNIKIDVSGGFIMSRKLIPNVEKLYQVKSENYMFPSCMRSVMAAFNEDQAYDFSFFAGVSGDFFTQLWLEPKWRYNDSYSNVCKASQKPIKAAFDACGYEYTYVDNTQIKENEAEMLQKIIASIDKGLPVLAFGIVGPPNCSIICGYAQDGKQLIGWSQFTGETNEDELIDQVCAENYFQVGNDLTHIEALIFFGKQKPRVSIAENIKQSILNIPALAALPSTDELRMGKDAFDAWADSLLCDEYFQDETMLEGPLDTYQSCVVQTGTNLFYLDAYLNNALKLCPEIEAQLKTLIDLFAQEKAAFDQLIEYQGGYFFEKDRKALLDKNFRDGLAKHVKAVGSCYEKAVQSIK